LFAFVDLKESEKRESQSGRKKYTHRKRAKERGLTIVFFWFFVFTLALKPRTKRKTVCSTKREENKEATDLLLVIPHLMKESCD